MRVDPIIEELHAVRQQLMREAGGDLAVAIERASAAGKRYRATHKCKVIQGVPRRPTGWMPASESAQTPKTLASADQGG